MRTSLVQNEFSRYTRPDGPLVVTSKMLNSAPVPSFELEADVIVIDPWDGGMDITAEWASQLKKYAM